VGGDLKLCEMSKPIYAFFELIRLYQIFEIFNTKEEAISAFQAAEES
jgi:anti-anti-sigma regulatory factor